MIQAMIHQARKPLNRTGDWRGHRNELRPLTLVHMSDIHGDGVELSRLCDFLDEGKELFEDCLCTGDMGTLRWNSGMDFWYKEPRAHSILTCIGNHDTLTDPDPVGWDWSQKANQTDSYRYYFAPFIQHWDCIYQENHTYYYKDYPLQKVRLIVLDCMLDGADAQAQAVWLEQTMEETKGKGFYVVIGIHYPIHNQTAIHCSFTSLDTPQERIGSEKSVLIYQEAVQKFIDGGGNFVTWLAGHTHQDFVGYSTAFGGKQLCITINALNREQCDDWGEASRVRGLPSQDLFNVITFDLSCDLIKIIRIGCPYDRYLRKRDTLCINYKTLEIIE